MFFSIFLNNLYYFLFLPRITSYYNNLQAYAAVLGFQPVIRFQISQMPFNIAVQCAEGPQDQIQGWQFAVKAHRIQLHSHNHGYGLLLKRDTNKISKKKGMLGQGWRKTRHELPRACPSRHTQDILHSLSNKL